MDVEHLWQYNPTELTRLNSTATSTTTTATTKTTGTSSSSSSSASTSTSPSVAASSTANKSTTIPKTNTLDTPTNTITTNPLLASAGISSNDSNSDIIADLCHVADHRLYKIVKWCKSLPLFKNISVNNTYIL